MKRFAYLVFIIAFAAFLFFSRISAYKEFHDAKIDGRIDTIYRYKDYVMISVDDIEFSIIPVSINGHYSIDETAKKGDYLFKPQNNDTLHLVHETDEGYFYTVKKF